LKDLRRGDRGQAAIGALAGVAIFVGAIALLVFGYNFVHGWKSTPPDKLALHYTGGPIQGVHFKEVIPAGQAPHFRGLMENWYLYPSTQRTYIVDSNPGSGDRPNTDFIHTVSSDHIEADWNMAVAFKLNTEPSVIKRFHEQLGLKYQAWTDDGWNNLLDQTLRQVLENKMAAETGKYTIDQLYGDPTTRQAIQDAVGADLKNGVNAQLGGDFFCGPTFDPNHPEVCPPLQFIIKGQPKVPDGVAARYQSVKNAALDAETAKNNVAAATQQELAAEQLNKALSNPNYVLYQAVQSGKVQFWVLPSGVNVTVPAPAPK
jgi:hypothetical protein